MSAQLDQVLAQAANDPDVIETQEWLDALEAVIETEGPERAHYLMERMVDLARRRGAQIPFSSNTAYVNTIPAHMGEHCPGDLEIEERLRSWMRWNAMAMVVKANRLDGDLGGHLSSFASLANMLGIGFNHFWHAPSENHGGDLLYIQGHSSPGIYARAFLEGRLTEEQLLHFRREVDGNGLSSYPHPKLMPDFWQFPTVSMGLGPLMAIYQARFLKYLHARSIADTANRKVWAFCGDGEMDEPESMGAIGMAGRERLDNLVIVVNCNLQRLDGPVRGNGKIIQELESDFRGAGWNVVKVIWGAGWDDLLARDKEGILQRVMMETVDGEYQNYKAKDGAFVRKHFFGKHPKLLELVSKMSDDDIWHLTRGGHDPHKIYAAFKVAQEHKGQPTVLLVKSIKGYGFGKSGEARNTAHNTKKLDDEAIKAMRDRFQLPISDEQLPSVPFFKPADDTPEMQYLHARRKALGGYLPQRRQKADEVLVVPELSAFKGALEPTAEGREISTTQAYVRILNTLLRDPSLGQRVVPIMVDESRTFGMEGLFRQIGIFSQVGQLYEPVDKDQVMYYREDKAGQILQEGINEAGGMSSWIAAATSYSTNNRVMIPFYTYYSMFGLQRIGDLAWAAGDMRARGFLLGGTAGRTTLNGEGLQHEDGHSHVLASTIPNCVPYDPTFSHEVAVIMHDGLRRMVTNQEDVFYYLTLMNENYSHPGLKEGQEEGIIKGLYLLQEGGKKNKQRVQLMGSGTILREVIEGAALLASDWGVDADVWSAPSFTLLARDGQDVERWNMLHPTDTPRVAHITQCLQGTSGPIIVSTDYMRTFAEQTRAFVPAGRTFKVLGTDGFGRSDTRAKLREFFEVNRYYVAVAALKALADEGKIKASVVADAITKYGINPDKPNPVTQ
ncbi:pyruvate dehydrogenase (acetyl-transferring), homodimeric type [Collimonas pratensis]|uniref:Pyruvate dehydrogenase E1 component n=1 Tax=Collimonas pratensis TaxID=279113 RepID=A0A127R3Q8_9BURK|nr:pyruvate dehydrogenase (acetyl-transferring), homodimeric type [Collimonas pratensis]AMP06696.1 pyruvate dehydrogenase (acetyl-transferring), homodimeric type [Collimonas pratensis]AMP16552.1 pyruvate dehydrogenase (acetyl-transferring), homodimeric type [Collimonas pratensis]NKI72497.1 pyruvate dehydrogenase (acetyl-transferring), homodimeric type [Collimonas pratensis]